MERSPEKILLTGPPRCGKTTLVMKIVSDLSLPARGFFTEEVRGIDGRRMGFDVVTLNGRRGPLARVGADGPRVGGYGVSLDFLENSAIPELLGTEGGLAVVDEIGKMECLSRKFTGAIRALLERETPLIATIALGGSSFIREVRSRPDIELIEVTLRNRERLFWEMKKRFEG